MATQKQQDEKRVQTLRKMVALVHNRHCFTCGQRGPTYVDMTIGAFVCTSCSGILRGINPPHRVKSISMASFTQGEVEELLSRGNEYNRQVWLGLHETKEPPLMDNKDEIKLRDYITSMFERKRWYTAPTDSLAETAKTMNSSTQAQQSSVLSMKRPAAAVRVLPGLGGIKAPPTSQQPVKQSLSNPASTKQTTTPQISAPSNDQLLADMFSSVPATSQPTVQTTVPVQSAAQPAVVSSANNAMFPATFDAFGSGQSQAPQQSNNLIPNINNTPLIPNGSSGAQTASSSTPVNQPSAINQPPAGIGGDRYSSLTGLFSDMTVAPAAPVVPEQNGVNWNSISWGAGASTEPPVSSGNISWGGSTQPQQPGSSLLISTQPTSMSGWGQSAAPLTQPATSGVNPFLATAQPAAQNTMFNAFSTPPQPAQTNVSTGFPFQQHNTMQGMPGMTQQTPFGQPAQPTQQIWGAHAPQPAGNWAQPNQWGAAAGQQTFQANMMAQPAVSSANPFLIQTAQPVMPQATSTNPFL